MHAIAKMGALAGLLLLGACNPAGPRAAQEIAQDTACTLDGMVLADFPGPKAQIQYAEGAPDFYCDLMELFGVMLAPEQKRSVAGVYVQDMGATSWEHPVGHWIAAKTALYVVGSRKRGSMGSGIGAFSSLDAAQAFAKAEGGKVLAFGEIDASMLKPHSMAM